MILPPTTNLDESKDRLCISPSTGYYMYPEKKIHQIQENNNLRKKIEN